MSGHTIVPPAVLGERTPQGTLSWRKHAQFSWIANFIWGIADDVLRDSEVDPILWTGFRHS